MSYFIDTFDRADGALDNDWSEVYLYVGVTSNQARARYSYAGRARRYMAETNTSAKIRAVSLDGVNPALPEVFVGMADNNHWYGLFTEYAAGVLTLKLISNYQASQTLRAMVNFHTDVPLDITLEVKREGSLIAGYWNGTLVMSAYTNLGTPNSGVGFGIGTTNTAIEWFESEDLASLSVTVNPDAVGLSAGEVELTITGTGTAWTPGTPGSPTFEVPGATIVSQWVAETGLAYVTIAQAPTVNYTTLIDPSTGQDALLTLTNDAALLGGGGGGGGADSALIEEIDDKVNWLTTFIGGAPADERTGVFTNWYNWLFGDGGSQVGVGSDLAEVVRQFSVASSDPETLRYVLELIRQIVAENAVRLDAMTGEGAYDLADVAITVQGAGSKTLGDLSDAISAVRGTNNVDLTAVFSSLYNLRTENGYTLLDVSNWISNLSEPDYTAITDAIANLDGDVAAVKAVVDGIGAYSDTAVLAAIAALALAVAAGEAASVGAAGAVGTAVAAGVAENTLGWAAAAAGFLDVLAAIAAVANTLGSLSVDLQPALDAIDGLSTAVDDRFDLVDTALVDLSEQVAALKHHLDYRLPVIYPGAWNVTWGDPVEIDAEGTVNATMDGVRVELDTIPPDIGHQAIPGHDRYMYLGALVFTTAEGDLDEREQITWDQAIYVPKCSSAVSGVVVRCRPGVHLTVTPWALAVV